MNDWLTLICPACWQKQDVEVEPPGEETVELVTDCEVCCRPMLVQYWDDGEGELVAEVDSANE
jgi:hypothetical protein